MNAALRSYAAQAAGHRSARGLRLAGPVVLFQDKAQARGSIAMDWSEEADP
jgi:hypothetical protein